MNWRSGISPGGGGVPNHLELLTSSLDDKLWSMRELSLSPFLQMRKMSPVGGVPVLSKWPSRRSTPRRKQQSGVTDLTTVFAVVVFFKCYFIFGCAECTAARAFCFCSEQGQFSVGVVPWLLTVEASLVAAHGALEAHSLIDLPHMCLAVAAAGFHVLRLVGSRAQGS